MPYESLLTKLADDFERFTRQSTAPDTVIEHLSTVYAGSEPSLATLLDNYYQGTVVFYPLLRHENISSQTPLIKYLIGINNNILTMPLHEKIPRSTTLLRLFLTNTREYSEIIQWIATDKAHLIEKEKVLALDTKKKQYAELLNIAIICLEKKEYSLFLTLMLNRSPALVRKLLTTNHYELLYYLLINPLHILYSLLDPESVRNLLTANNNEFLHNLLTKPLPILYSLLEKDISIALIPFESKTLFDYFASNVEYQPLFQLIKKKIQSATPKPSLVEKSLLLKLSKPNSVFNPLNQQLSPYINTDNVVPPCILNAHLQSFNVYLTRQNILLMDCINDTDAISASEIHTMGAGKSITYTHGVAVNGDLLEPCFKQKILADKPQYVVWPIVRHDQKDYALLILDLTGPTTTVPSKGYYIEPFSKENQCKRMQSQSAEEAAPQPPLQFAQPEDTAEVAVSAQCQQTLDMKPSDFSYIYLNQDPNYPWSSELITAIIIRLVCKYTLPSQPDRSQPTSLFYLEHTHLSYEEVMLLRLLRIQHLGRSYFDYQIPAEYKTEEFNGPYLSQQVLIPTPKASTLSVNEASFFAKPKTPQGSQQPPAGAMKDALSTEAMPLTAPFEAMHITNTKTLQKTRWKPPVYRINPSPLGLFVESPKSSPLGLFVKPRDPSPVSDANAPSTPSLPDEAP